MPPALIAFYIRQGQAPRSKKTSRRIVPTSLMVLQKISLRQVVCSMKRLLLFLSHIRLFQDIPGEPIDLAVQIMMNIADTVSGKFASDPL